MNGWKNKKHVKWMNGVRNKVCDNQGFSLPIAMLIVLVLAIGLAMFQTSILSFAMRTAVMHNDLQPHLSARSVANAVVEKIVDDTNESVVAYIREVCGDNALLWPLVVGMGGLDLNTIPAELRGFPEELLLRDTFRDLEPEEEAFIEELMELQVGDYLVLQDIEFVDWPADVDQGTLEAKITRTKTDEYVVSAIATVEGNTDTVHVILKTNEVTEENIPSTEVPVMPGNANVFFSDYGFGLYSGKTMDNQLEGVPFVSSIPVYIADLQEPGTDYYDQIQSYQEIFYVGFDKEQGAFVTKSDLYYAGGLISNVEIHTDGMVTLGSDTIVNGNEIIADTVYLTGNNITISVPIYAKKLIIDATNVRIGGAVEVEELQVVKSSSAQTAETVKVNTADGKAYVVSAPNFSDNTTIPESTLPTDAVTTLSLEPGIIGISFNFEITAELNSLLELPETSIAPRTEPSWSNLSGVGYEIKYEGDGDTSTVEVVGAPDTISESMLGVDTNGNANHYYIVKNGSSNNLLTLNYRTINTTDLGDDEGDKQVVIVVEDGQTLYLKTEYFIAGATTYEPGVYIILEGNAKLHLASSGSWPGLRVYGESASSDDHTTIVEAVRTTIDNVELDDYTDMNAYVGAVQDAIHDEIQNEHLGKFSAIRLDEGARFQGTFVVPYVYSKDGNLQLYGKKYSYNALTEDAYGDGGGNATIPDPEWTVKLLFGNVYAYADSVNGVSDSFEEQADE